MSLNQKQKVAMQKVIEGKNLFISGSGGKGKSYLVRHIMDKFEDSTVLLAPTGIAALNIGGSTVHSTFKFPTTILTKKHYTRVHDKVRELFDKSGPVKRIIVDEVSMVRADMLECIDQHLRRSTRMNIPFGGIQLIVVGDFYQLPPVVANLEKKAFYSMFDSPFAFGGNAWAYGGFEYIELEENMRQSDEVFRGHLEKIRTKAIGYKQSVEFFNAIAKANTEDILQNDPVFICTTNKSAETLNTSNYEELEGEERTFRGSISGKFDTRPSPEYLNLKVGTKVIFTANKDEFKNGEIGYVAGFLDDKIEVIKEDTEETVYVEKHRWEDREYTVSNGDLTSFPIGSYIQYPLRHGWAVTIHKSQGLSLSNAVIDIGRGAFTSGQTYVALSRIRSLAGVGMISPIGTSDIIVDKAVQEFYANGCVGIGLGI